MAAIDGTWETTVKSPMGVQTSTMTLISSGDSFTGTSKGPMGDAEIADGAIIGDTITFKMKITQPMPMSLTGEATVSGDTLQGTVDTGAFGKFEMTGTRQA